VRGSQASAPFVDSASFTGLTLAPGQSTKRELKSIVAPSTPVGTHVLSGGAEWSVETGAATPVRSPSPLWPRSTVWNRSTSR
jgi:hypothetical protein